MKSDEGGGGRVVVFRLLVKEKKKKTRGAPGECVVKYGNNKEELNLKKRNMAPYLRRRLIME